MFVELSYPVSPDMPVYPGQPVDEFIPHGRIDQGAANNTTIVKHFLHSGTHVDAPYHFDAKGQTIDEIPIEQFVFSRPLIVDKRLGRGETLGVQELRGYGEALYDADLLLLCTGYYARRRDKAVYADDFPSLSAEAARFVRTELPRLRAVGIDTLSIESAQWGARQGFPVHRALLNGELFHTRALLIFEDVNMEPILGKTVSRVYGFPLRLHGLDASPVALVAEVI